MSVIIQFEFKIPVGKNGDCYDRYLCSIAEMRESVKIINQCLAFIAKRTNQIILMEKLAHQRKKEIKESMEALIHHFKLIYRRVPRG